MSNTRNVPTFEERQNMKRNRKKINLRFTQGIKQLFSKRINIIIFALFMATMILVWFYRYIFFVDPAKNIEKYLRLLCDIVFWSFFGLSFSGILVWLGKPKNAQTIEDDIKDVFNIKEAHKVPILVSVIPNKENNKVETYKFYSPDFAAHRYEEEKINIGQKWGVKIIDKIKNKGKYIFFDTISTEHIEQAKELTDDRI